MRVGSLRVLGARVVAAGARTASPGSRSSVLRMATQGWQRSRWRGTCASAAPHLCANSAAQLPVAGLEQAAHPACCDGAARIEVSAVSAEDDDDADTM
ncbi:hypothetical protein FVE85_2467 [Porphyridium purpureum]|uniref:Uncharacterized protein n=1 Tax=Porphyridium purpureum TaxID=35688 RepID=A0A5J4YKG5_PORPP|nr:hypothetical protein FVE85_2467 [Porphyridium purpureum]|eukprot:POR0080..scf291_13